MRVIGERRETAYRKTWFIGTRFEADTEEITRFQTDVPAEAYRIKVRGDTEGTAKADTIDERRFHIQPGAGVGVTIRRDAKAGDYAKGRARDTKIQTDREADPEAFVGIV